VTINSTTTPARVQRDARLRWIPIAEMRVSELAQRDLNQARVDKIAVNFDPEQVGTPTVNLRDGHFYIIDGQHRVAAMKEMGWGDQQVQCWVYEGLTQAEEAERFLKLSDTLAIDGFAKYRVGITAGRADECDIDRIVQINGLVVTKDELPGAISAVGTLRRVYERSGPTVLSRTLRIVRDAYGDPGLRAEVIDGIGMLCQRYNGELDEPKAIARLSAVMGGVNGLTGAAEILRRKTGRQKNHCVAAAAVDIINRGKGGKKLPNWWDAA
jgi:hypothetical protein